MLKYAKIGRCRECFWPILARFGLIWHVLALTSHAEEHVKSLLVPLDADDSVYVSTELNFDEFLDFLRRDDHLLLRVLREPMDLGLRLGFEQSATPC